MGNGQKHALIIVLLVTTLLRIPSLFEPYWYGDEGIYLTLGMAARRGLTLYRDIHDNKPPFLYLIAALAGTQFWFRFIALVWQLVTVAATFRLGVRLFPASSVAPLVSSITLVLLLTIFEGNIANGELFMVLPVLLGFSLVWSWHRRTTLKGVVGIGLPLVGGLSFSAGALFKIPALIDWGGALAFFVVVSSRTLRESLWKLRNPGVFVFVVAFTAPIAASLLYFAAVGGFEPYLRSALLQNIGYLGSWTSGEHAAGSAAQSGLLLRTLLLGIGTLVLWKASNRFRYPTSFRLLATWFLYALYGALLSERPYPHYLIEPAVPAALLIGALTDLRLTKTVRSGIGVLAIVALTSYLRIEFWHYPVIPYYQNFWAWLTKQKPTDQYFSYFGSQVNESYRVAKHIRMTTGPDERIFVWGDHPYLYALAQRLPAGRYTVAYHIVDFGAYEETLSFIRREKPRIIVTFNNGPKPFPELSAELASRYVLSDRIDNAMIYRRIESLRSGIL